MHFLLPVVFSDFAQFQSWFAYDERMLENEDGQTALLAEQRSHAIVSKLQYADCGLRLVCGNA